jgi:hypothetical protein
MHFTPVQIALLVTSLPFAPEIVLPTIDYFINEVKLTEFNRYGFKATFNPTYPVKSGNVAGYHRGITGLIQGPIILMIENYRTGLLWQLMRDCPYIASGLQRAGFGGVGYERHRPRLVVLDLVAIALMAAGM